MDSRASNLSNLSSEKYGYDFVVATTQASINSDLRLFLSEEDQPGNPTIMIGLEELLTLTDDSRVEKLFGARFTVGIKMQLGLPPGIAPTDLLPIISLGQNVTVVQLKPPNGWVPDGKWNVWSQPYGDPWYVQTKVNLTMASLNEQLDTPYLNEHPRIKERLKEALGNLSGTAFSLQQLLIDLDSAYLETVPTFKGIDDPDALDVLRNYFVKIYSNHAQNRLPLVSSSLKLTAFEREVNPPIGSSGATTLNYFFDWNWVLPKDIDNMKHLLDELPRCIITDQPKNWDNPVKFNLQLNPGQTPDTAHASGNEIFISYSKPGYEGRGHNGVTGEVFEEMRFLGQTLTVSQHLCFSATTLTTTYTISVNENGGLDPDLSGFWGMYGLTDVFHKLKNQVLAGNFIFPGAKVFTYKGASFSDYQDLICEITYLDPAQVESTTSTKLLAKQASGSLISYPARSTGQVLALTTSSEMMQNYVQGELVPATGKFEALQTDDGHALLFAIDDSGVFHVIVEESGVTQTGWQVQDLSSSAIQAYFSASTNPVVKTFDVGSALDGSICLAMAVTADGTDHLLWTSNPQWVRFEFDADGEGPGNIQITGTLFAKTMDKQHYLIVDIDRPSQGSAKFIERYYVDPSVSIGTRWEGNYRSCIGRSTGGEAQFIYEPVINVFGRGPPAPVRLRLPGENIPSAIATVRNLDNDSPLYGTTDLYAVGGSSLYRFAADRQKRNELPTAVVTSDVLLGTDTLLAMSHDGVTTLWGRNTNQLDLPGSWSACVPILANIERSTVFTSGGGRLQKLMQAQDITIASPPQTKSLSFKSYTTTIHVTNEHDLPARDVLLTISASSRTPVYMNGVYYVLGNLPTQVHTDAMGSVTVIEATEDINATVFTVTFNGGSGSITINPMDKVFSKLTALNSTDKLQDASFPSQTTAGGVVGAPASTPLVAPSTARGDIEVVAGHMDSLKSAYSNVKEAQSTILASRNHGVVPSTLFLNSGKVSSAGLGHDIAIAAGDLFRWLKSGIDAVIDVIYDAASGAWHFIAKIAGKVYRAVLDTVEAVVGAVEWVFNAIKTAIEDIIRFVEFLFEWDDIRRTKDVMHNVVRLWLRHQVDGISEAKADFDREITSVEQALNQWTGITDWGSLGPATEQTASGSASNPAEGQTSGSQLLAGHFRTHASELRILGDSPPFDATDNVIDDLLKALSNEGEVLGTTYTQLKELAKDFSSMNVEDVLKRLAGILGDVVLSSARVVVDALLDVLHDMASAAVTLLDTKIHIPVISDILNAIGVPDLSFLDLFAWIAAVAYTVVYKIGKSEAPFPDNNEVQTIISATSWDQLAGMFSGPSMSISPYMQKCIFIAGHSISGFMCLTGDFVNTFEAEGEAEDNPFSIPSAIMGFIAAGSQGASDFLVPKDAIENKAVSTISTITTGAVIAAKVVFSGPAQKRFAAPEGSKFKPLAVGDGRATGAIVNSILVIPALVVSGWHFYELSTKPAGATRSAAIVGEVSNLASYISRIAYAVAQRRLSSTEDLSLYIGPAFSSLTNAHGQPILRRLKHGTVCLLLRHQLHCQFIGRAVMTVYGLYGHPVLAIAATKRRGRVICALFLRSLHSIIAHNHQFIGPYRGLDNSEEAGKKSGGLRMSRNPTGNAKTQFQYPIQIDSVGLPADKAVKLGLPNNSCIKWQIFKGEVYARQSIKEPKNTTSRNMSTFKYYSLPGFGEECREKYGFSDSCIIGDRMIVTGHTGMDALTLKTSPIFEEEVTQAFQNINDLILLTLKKEGRTIEEGKTGWDYVVKLHAYLVNLSTMRDEARETMVRHIKKFCPNHQPLFTMVGVESLPFPEHHIELEVDIWLK
ncbi:hypothetical protein BDV30DRAFT_247903 [Aspergillus minisclerotigenes]|uniref:Uncharacterized protein n=1 Tax=Aspergillus minisclerotigenes TaxID=656917 RepID=A0A5N6J8Z7_9EURO|nr:hypothetical protein BDV30DRAFT_247903 [Aspergillus minisclerotigenes]